MSAHLFKWTAALFVMGALFFASAASAEDETIPVDQVHVSTPMYKPSGQFEPPLGTYEYGVSWEGIPAASASLTVTKEGNRYRIISSAKTASAIDLVYKLRYHAEGLIDARELRPIRTVIDHQENSRFKNTQMVFRSNGEIETVRSNLGKGSTVLKFTSDNFTLDPFSAAFLARSVDWKIGESYEFDTFNGKVRYLVTLTAVGKSTMQFGEEQREVWVISPKVVNLTNPRSKKKLREARIFLSADERREVLEVTSSVFIGSVTTKLENFTPLSPGAAMHLAANDASGLGG